MKGLAFQDRAPPSAFRRVIVRAFTPSSATKWRERVLVGEDEVICGHMIRKLEKVEKPKEGPKTDEKIDGILIKGLVLSSIMTIISDFILKIHPYPKTVFSIAVGVLGVGSMIVGFVFGIAMAINIIKEDKKIESQS